MKKNFTEIGDVIVRNEIRDFKFTCDLDKCKGACCTMESDYGAPVDKEEIDIIEEYLPVIKRYIPDSYKTYIEQNGFWEEKYGDLMLKSIDNRDCVFVNYDGDVAKCGIEKAFLAGEIDFIKPISCHLFPIRISNFGGAAARFEYYTDCEPAIKKGNKTGLSVYEFCKDALTRKFGKKWFSKLKEKFK